MLTSLFFIVFRSVFGYFCVTLKWLISKNCVCMSEILFSEIVIMIKEAFQANTRSKITSLWMGSKGVEVSWGLSMFWMPFDKQKLWTSWKSLSGCLRRLLFDNLGVGWNVLHTMEFIWAYFNRRFENEMCLHKIHTLSSHRGAWMFVVICRKKPKMIVCY